MINRSKYYLLLILISIVTLQNTFFELINYGLTFTSVDGLLHFSRGNLYTEISDPFSLAEVYVYYPPGYSIFVGVLLLFFEDSFLTWYIFRAFSAVLVILLSFIFGNKLINAKLGILVSLFSALPLGIVYYKNDGGNFLPALNITSPSLNGSDTDIILILSQMVLIIFILDRHSKTNFSNNKFILVLFFFCLIHALSHTNRLLMIFASVIIFSLAIQFTNHDRKVKTNALHVSLTYQIALLCSYLFHYSNVFNSTAIGEEFANKIPGSLDSISLNFSFYFALFVTFNILVYVISFNINTNIISNKFVDKYWIVYTFFALSISITILYSGSNSSFSSVSGPYFIGNASYFGNILILAKHGYSLLIFFSSFAAYYYIRDQSIRRNYRLILELFLISLMVYLISIWLDFVSRRMGAFYIFRPLFIGSAIYFSYNFLSRINLRHITIPVVTFLVILIQTFMIFNYVISPPIIMGINDYDNTIKSRDYQENIGVSINIIKHLNKVEHEDKLILTLAENQKLFTALYPISPISEEHLGTIFRNEIYFLSFFESYDSEYLVITQRDIISKDNTTIQFNTDKYDNYDFLDITYTNSLGEKVYFYNGGLD